MVYKLYIYVDGGCRNNGRPDAIGAAAAIIKFRNGGTRVKKQALPSDPAPTNQRAEITAIILALQQALHRISRLCNSPKVKVRIHSDSKYAIGCMTEWLYKWSRNGWRNAAGREVANLDLIFRASSLDDELTDLATVSYIWIPRVQNVDADRCCNRVMDMLES